MKIRSLPWVMIGVFFLIAFLIYGASLRNGFVQWDDGLLIYENPAIRGITFQNLKTIFTTYDPELYIPLTLFSYQMDYLISGTNAAFYHLHALILHVINALLVAYFLKNLTRNSVLATVVGLLFLVHPLHTEAVAWSSARKDLLSTMFFLLSIIAYMRYGETEKKSMLFGSLFAFVLGLLAKVTVLTLPVVLLLIEWKDKGRISRRAFMNVLPFFALSAVFAAIAAYGKTGVLEAATPVEVITMAGKSTIFYLSKLLWPLHLSVLYPYNGNISFFSWDFFPSFLGVCAIAVMALLSVWKTGTVAFCTAFFAVTLAPSLLNFAKAGSYYIASDRYAYIPSIGIFLLLGYCALYAFGKGLPKQYAGFFIASVLIALSVKARAQSLTWQNSESLFGNVITLYPDSHIAHNNMGNVYRRRGELDKAVQSYRTALAIRTGDQIATDDETAMMEFENNLGNVLIEKGDLDQAISHFSKGLSKEANAQILSNMGSAYRQLGRLEEAKQKYRQSLLLRPANEQALVGIGIVEQQLGEIEKAEESFQEAILLNPLLAVAHLNLGALFVNTGRVEEGIAAYEKAIEANPFMPQSYYNLGVAYRMLQRNREALGAYEKAVLLEPSFVAARINLGILYAERKKLDLAIEQFREVLRYDPDNARALSALEQLGAL